MNAHHLYTDLIRHLLAFMPLPGNFVKLLIPHLIMPVTYSVNTTLLKPGETAGLAYWLVKGYMRTYIKEPFELGLFTQKTVDIWKPGVINLPVNSYINQEPVNLYLEVAAKSTVVGFSYNSFRALGKQMPEVFELALKIVANAELAWQEKMSMAKVKSLKGYLAFLDYFDVRVEQYIELKHIASYIGMTPEHLSTLRNKGLRD